MNAGKQASDSGIATPFNGIKKMVELRATTAKIVASIPMLRSNGSCLVFNPITSNDIASNTKKEMETIRCSVKIVSGNNPIPISASELKHRIRAPSLQDSIFIIPIENIKKRKPPNIMPVLNNGAVASSIPKSLKA